MANFLICFRHHSSVTGNGQTSSKYQTLQYEIALWNSMRFSISMSKLTRFGPAVPKRVPVGNWCLLILVYVIKYNNLAPSKTSCYVNWAILPDSKECAVLIHGDSEMTCFWPVVPKRVSVGNWCLLILVYVIKYKCNRTATYECSLKVDPGFNLLGGALTQRRRCLLYWMGMHSRARNCNSTLKIWNMTCSNC